MAPSQALQTQINGSKSSPRGPNGSKSSPGSQMAPNQAPGSPNASKSSRGGPKGPEAVLQASRRLETSGMLPEAVLQDHSKGIRLPEGSQKPFYKGVGTSRRLGRGFQKAPRKRFTAILKG